MFDQVFAGFFKMRVPIPLRLYLLACLLHCCGSALAADQPSAATNTTPTAPASGGPGFFVREYQLQGESLASTNSLMSALARHAGTNVSLTEIVEAASLVQSEYAAQGRTNMTVAIAPPQKANGVVAMTVFRGLVPQILVAGERYVLRNGEALPATRLSAADLAAAKPPQALLAATNAPAANTNAGPRFVVRAYEIRGDTLLSTDTLTKILAKYTGTNIAVADIIKACSDLQLEYRDRGFPTVNVTLPPQQITNGIVKVRVFEGRLSEITILGNRYFSSNNVMRALPSLQTNMIINGPVFQGELDRANANQDRQVYPQLEPGEVENTTALRLKVEDRLPLHAKIELNNQSSPGTPELRLNTSAVYNNLWQLEHQIGVQYSFSPENYKNGDEWAFYDKPLVANYSAFYRLPLAIPESEADVIAAQPGNFGYDEATRRFRLPPSYGVPELNIYGSRSTIDTGVMNTLSTNLFNTGTNSLDRQDFQQDLTRNEDLGLRLSFPLRPSANFQSGLSGGLDFKTYGIRTFKTNVFTLTQIEIDTESNPGHPTTNIIVSVDRSPVPTNGVTSHSLEYLPLSMRWDGTERDASGTTAFGVGYSANFWYNDTKQELQEISGSKRSTGKWISINGSVTRDQMIFTNWDLSLHADGQLASEPLISNEQYGLGGVNSVRGYREGEIFGDSGWRVSAEQKTPPYVMGLAYAKNPVTVRGSVFMDYGEVYYYDPAGRDSRIPLWGAGVGGVASVGPHWEARFLVAWPLLKSPTTEADQPRFNFSLTAQF